MDYPLLGKDYVEDLLGRLAAENSVALPSIEVALEAFKILGHRPEQMLRAFLMMKNTLPEGVSPDVILPVIAATLRTTAADIEFNKIDEMGGWQEPYLIESQTKLIQKVFTRKKRH